MSTTTPGWKTSEFAITVVAALVGLVAASGVFDDNSRWASLFGYIQTTLVTLGYSIARGITKSGASKAEGVVAAARVTAASANFAAVVPGGPAPSRNRP